MSGRATPGGEEVVLEAPADPSSRPLPDVRAIRERLGLTQAAFAARFGLPASTVSDLERGLRPLKPHVRMLLTVIDREPEAVARALTRT